MTADTPADGSGTPQQKPHLETTDVEAPHQSPLTQGAWDSGAQAKRSSFAAKRGSRAGKGIFRGFNEWWWTAFGGVDPAGADVEGRDQQAGEEGTSMPFIHKDAAYGSEGAFGGTTGERSGRLTQTFSPTKEAGDTGTDSDEFGVSKEGTAGFAASVFNLCNVCMGAGCLAMPFAFKNTGLLLGLSMLVLVWALMCISAVRLCDVARKLPNHHLATYGGVARSIFGERGTTITQIIIVVSCTGIATSYFQLVGDLLAPPLAYWAGDDPSSYCSFWLSRNGIMIYALFFEVALCALPTLYALRYVSVAAVGFMYYTTFALVFRSGQHWSDGPLDGDEFAAFKLNAQLFRTMSILTFSFAPHIQVVQMFAEMKDRSPENVKRWIWTANTISLIAFGMIGAFGYYMFYGETQGNILLNHEADDTLITIGRIGVAISVMAGYPTQVQPCMATLDRLAFPNREPSIWGRRLVWLAVVVGVTFFLAYIIDDVSIAMGLTGAGGLTAACFLLPSWMYIKTFEPEVGGMFVTWNQRIAWATIVLGVVFGSSALVVNMIDAFDGSDVAECIWPEGCPAQRCCPANETYAPPTVPCP